MEKQIDLLETQVSYLQMRILVKMFSKALNVLIFYKVLLTRGA